MKCIKYQFFILTIALSCVLSGGACCGEDFQKDFSPGWLLVSFPFESTATEPAAFLGVQAPMIFGYSDNEYKGADNGLEIARGTGYWIKFSEAESLSITGTPVSADTRVDIPVSGGWNLVGNPFNENIEWSDVLINGVSVMTYPLVNKTIYGYDATAGRYEIATTLEPWKGYWVYVAETCWNCYLSMGGSKISDSTLFTWCSEVLAALRVGQDMFITDYGYYAGDFDLLAWEMIAECEDMTGQAPECKGKVEANIRKYCDNPQIRTTDSGMDYEITVDAKDQYSCKLCATKSGYWPESYSSCSSGMLRQCP